MSYTNLMREKRSRFEVNKEVRRVLTRNGADTNQVSFQVYGREINLYGNLIHGDGSDFGALEIENLLTDFTGTLPGYNITGDTSSWVFSHQSIQKVGLKENKEDEEGKVDLVKDDDSLLED